MIYVYKGGEVADILESVGQPVTDNLQDADCIVIEWPAEITYFEKPVFVLTDGLISWSEWKKISGYSYKVAGSMEELIRQVNSFSQDKKTKQNAPNEVDIDDVNAEPETDQGVIYKMPNDTDIIVSCSTAGGVGKTFWAANLGACLAGSGYKAAVVDFDLWAGDIPNTFGLGKDKDVVAVDNWSYFSKTGSVNNDDFLRHQSGVCIIPCTTETGLSKSDYISGEDAESFLKWLSPLFDIIIVDLGNNPYLPHAEISLNMAKYIFLIAGTDTKTIDKVSRFTHQEQYKERHSKINLIINMVSAASYYKPEKVAKKFRFKEFEEIPFDEKGVNAATRAKSLPVQLKGSTAGDAVKEIAMEYYSIMDSDVTSGNKSLLGKMKSIFKR